MTTHFNEWMMAVVMTMNNRAPAIFKGYKVRYVGVYEGKPKADNDNDKFPVNMS
jgi:hypothetical protein